MDRVTKPMPWGREGAGNERGSWRLRKRGPWKTSRSVLAAGGAGWAGNGGLLGSGG